MKHIINEVSDYLIGDSEWTRLNRHNDNWLSDPVFKNYHKLGNKQKGVAGEYFVEQVMKRMGFAVTPPSDPGHDRTIGGVKAEIKFSLAVSKGDRIISDKFIINHVAVGKDWERLIFCGINPEDSFADRMRMFYFDKADFAEYIRKNGATGVFKHQQSGQKIGNDDYICTKFGEFIRLPFVKSINDWR